MRQRASTWGPPAVLVLAALAARTSGLDLAIEDRLFDPASLQFPWRSSLPLEAIGHHALRTVLTALWAMLLAATAFSFGHARWREWRKILLATTVAMALGPVIVVALKSITTFPCPWNLARYGGFASESPDWFTAPSRAGQCFPAGHAAGGFSLVALFFALEAAGRPRLARVALAIAVGAGSASAAVRILQGAHFLSHTLWAAAIDWLVCAWAIRRFGVREGRRITPLAAGSEPSA